eukprot:SAG31_NODE_33973_length_338_cov_0.732218_1_plen_43_part_10
MLRVPSKTITTAVQIYDPIKYKINYSCLKICTAVLNLVSIERS